MHSVGMHHASRSIRSSQSLWTSLAALGGASLRTGAARVAFWGAAAMGATALVADLFERPA